MSFALLSPGPEAVPVVEHGQELHQQQDGKAEQEHEAERLHLHGLSRHGAVWVVLGDMDADGVANGLEEKGGDDPKDIQDEVKEHGLQVQYHAG